MKCGFTYKNRHSSEFDIVAKTISRPVLPEMKSYTAEAPLADGIYDFSEANEYGRAFYSDRFFEIQMQINAEDIFSLEKKVSKAACWLSGRGELIFDDMPNVKWRAAVMSELGFMPELRGKKTVMTVNFRVEPFSRCVFNTSDGFELDGDICLDANIPIDIPRVFTWQYGNTGSGYSDFTKTVQLVNMGNVYTRPILEFIGDIKRISLKCNGKKLKISASSESGFTADFEKQTVTDIADGQSVMTYVTGDFFEIPPGGCNMEMTINAKGSGHMQVIYNPKYIYAFDIDDVDWSESNA